jgi:hypothetical protein
VTPLLADAWEHKLRNCALHDKFSDIVHSIRFGFKMGIWTTITTTYTPPNHASATSAPVAVLKYIHNQLALGHYSGPYSRNSQESLIGPFCTSLLSIIPKSNGLECIIQDLSAGDSKHPLVNSKISPNVFLTKWGLHKKVVPIVLQVPPRSLAAMMDMDTAFCRCLVRLDQQNHHVVMWDRVFYLDHCVAFGAASACGVFGRLAPFNNVFTYLGFQWLLSRRTIEIPAAKKAKYLTHLVPWAARGAAVSCRKAEIVLGTLVHCMLAMPDGCTQLIALMHMVSAFEGARNRFSRWTPSTAVLDNIAFWCAKLSVPFCDLVLHDPPPLSPVEFWVDASTSYGVGAVFAGHWAAWQFHTGWKANGRNIGWDKMIAIELGIWVATKLGFRNTHFLVRSDNTGVIGLVSLGKARNTKQNRSLQCTIALMCASNLCIMSKYVALVANIADTPSRSVPAVDCKPLLACIPILPCLFMYLLDK